MQIHGKKIIFWSHLSQSHLCYYATVECHTHPVTNHQGLLGGSAFFPLRYILNAVEVHVLLSGPQQIRYGTPRCPAHWLALDMYSIAPCFQSKARPLLDGCRHCNSLRLVCLNHHLPLNISFSPNWLRIKFLRYPYRKKTGLIRLSPKPEFFLLCAK